MRLSSRQRKAVADCEPPEQSTMVESLSGKNGLGHKSKGRSLFRKQKDTGRPRLPLFRRQSAPSTLVSNDCIRDPPAESQTNEERVTTCSFSESKEGSSAVNPMAQTKVLTVVVKNDPTIFPQEESPCQPCASGFEQVDDEMKTALGPRWTRLTPFCATEALFCAGVVQHYDLEFLCNSRIPDIRDRNYFEQQQFTIPDDPAVRESIECVYPSQLKQGLPSLFSEEDDDAASRDMDYTRMHDNDEVCLVAPSTLQQSILKTRSFPRRIRSPPTIGLTKKKYRENLVHVDSFRSNLENSDDFGNTQNAHTSKGRKSEPCFCCKFKAPVLPVEEWPQRPLLLRPTPGSGTRIKGIRFSTSSEYLWTSANDIGKQGGRNNVTWSDRLKEHWGRIGKTDDASNSMEEMCEQCIVLPINNGNEQQGETLVTDFETDLFDGTLMLRLRHSEGTTPEPYDDCKGYFLGLNRQYQAVIQGRFKRVIPLTECVTGFQLERPLGKLPPKWILKGGLKIISLFAPQLQARFHGDSPTTVAPLGSAPQAVIVDHCKDSTDVPKDDKIEVLIEEPICPTKTLLGEASTAETSLQRSRTRKKAFDKLYSLRSAFPATDPTKVYTFEFLQHLVNFAEYSIDLGKILGSIKLKEGLDGQPLQIMAMHESNKIWAFDIWHEELLEDAKRHDAARAGLGTSEEVKTCT